MLSDTIREHYENNQPLDEILHEEALQEFYHYCIVGGMPAAVKADLAKAQSIGADGNSSDAVKFLYCRHDKICKSDGHRAYF